MLTRIVCLVALAGSLAAPTVAQPPPVRIDQIHADLGTEYVNGAWSGYVRVDASPRYNNVTSFAPNEADLVVNASSITNRLVSSAFNFIGVGAGQPYHRLSQNQQAGQLYLGVSNERMTTTSGPGGASWAEWTPRPGLFTAEYVALQVQAVRAPVGGHFSMWQSTDSGPEMYVSTFLNGFTNEVASSTNNFRLADNTFFNFIGGHVHYNWGFTEPGRYEIDIAPIAYAAGNVPVTLNEGQPPITFVFDVVPVPEPGLILAASVAGLGAWRLRTRRRHPA